MRETFVHDHWSNRFAFIMAAVGSAVGLGNIWRFPYITGENGGGAFILIYVVTTIAIGLPILIAELMIGRMGGQSPVNTVNSIVDRFRLSAIWKLIGWGSVIGAFVVLSYYSVIGGWAFRYVLAGFMGGFSGMTPDAAGSFFGEFTGSAAQLTFWHTLFMAVNITIVLGGLKFGIERAVTVMMPLLFLLLVAMVIYGATTAGFSEGFAFLFDFDFSKVTANTFLTAIGQGFFSLSVALAAMMTYGAYLDRDVSIPRSAGIIAFADTLVALLAGLAIFPLVFTFALEPSGGPGLIFVTLPIAFGKMAAGGPLLATLFFLLLSVAAITSAISLLEPAVSWAEESWGFRRSVTAMIVGGAAWFVGLASVFSFNDWSGFFPLAPLGLLENATIFDALDYSITNILMPTIGLLMSLFAGWALSRDAVAEALDLSPFGLGFRAWRFLMRYLAPLGVLSIFIANVVAG